MSPTIASIQSAVCARYGLHLRDMWSGDRHRSVARPRQIAVYLVRGMTPKSWGTISKQFGGRDNSTLIHACRNVEALRATDPELDAAVSALTAELSR